MGEMHEGELDIGSYELLEQYFLIKVSRRENTVLALLVGDLDIYHEVTALSTLTRFIDSTNTGDTFAVNLKYINFIDGTGLKVLSNLQSMCLSRDLSFAIHDPSDKVIRLLEVSGDIDQFRDSIVNTEILE